MNKRNNKVTRKIAALLSAIMLSEQLAGTGVVLYAHAEDDAVTEYSIEHNVNNSWDGGCSAEIILTNLADTETKDWEISFCTKDNITSLWGGNIVDCQEYLVEATSVEPGENEEETSEAEEADEETIYSEDSEDAEAEVEAENGANVEDAEVEESGVVVDSKTETTEESARKEAEETEDAEVVENEESEESEDLEEVENGEATGVEEAAEAEDVDAGTEEVTESENAAKEATESENTAKEVTESENAAKEALEEESEEDAIYYRYTVEALEYNAVIEAGDHITIGYNAEGNDHDIWDAEVQFTYAPENIVVENTSEDHECIHENAFDYVLCTTGGNDTLEINAGDIEIRGDVHSNSDFVYRGNSLIVDGAIESSGSTTISVSDPYYQEKIGDVLEDKNNIEMPDVYEDIRESLKENADRFTSDLYCSGDIADISGNIYAEGYAGIYTPITLSNGILFAEEGIHYSCGTISNTEDTRILLVCGKGDIWVNASNVSIYGNIYAPNGSVFITGSDVEIHGRITAKNFNFYGSNLKLIADSGDLDIYHEYEVPEEDYPNADGNIVPEKKARLINISDVDGDHDALRSAMEMLDTEGYDTDYLAYEIHAGSISQSEKEQYRGNADTIAQPDSIAAEGIELRGRTSEDAEHSYDLSWKLLSDAEVAGYRLLRKMDNGEYTSISTWDGETHIRVLNIYPDWSLRNVFTDWMKSTIADTGNSADMGLFDIDTVAIEQYNADPDAYLKDEDGKYQYDVLFFGAGDSNCGKDLSSVGLTATKAFLNSGRGALLGHDTICNTGGAVHGNFAALADRLGIICSKNSTFSGSSVVEIMREGTLTNYPWEIRGRLNVPYSHTQGQLSGGSLAGIVWMKYVTSAGIRDAESGADNLGYLVTNNQVALIQTGHQNGAASNDERKILANTICYLAQLTMKNKCRDATAYDLAAPVLSGMLFKYQDDVLTLSLQAKDMGTLYNYYVSAVTEEESESELHSNSVYHNAKTGVAGYLVAVDESAEDRSDLTGKDADGNYPYFISASNGKLTYGISEDCADGEHYAHICVVDNAGNVSEQLTCKVDTEQADLFKALEEGADYIYLDADLSTWTDLERAELEKAMEESGAKIYIAYETADVCEEIRAAEEIRQELRAQNLFVGERAEVIIRNSDTGEEFEAEDIEVTLIKGEDRYVFDELPITFTEVGTYKVVVRVKQIDTWSEEMILTEDLCVTEKPQCKIETTTEYDADSETYVITTIEKTWGSEDGDLTSVYAWKKIGDTKWTTGSLPNRLDAGAVYLYRLIAENENGIVSNPSVSIIDAPMVTESIEEELFEEEKPAEEEPVDPEEIPADPQEEPQDDPDLIWITGGGLNEDQKIVMITGETAAEYNVKSMTFGVRQEDEEHRDLYQWYSDREGIATEDGVEFTYGDHKWTWYIPVEVLGNGPHTLFAEAKDDEGHESECCAEVTVTITEVIEVVEPTEPVDPEEEETYQLAWYTDVTQTRDGVSLFGEVTTERNVTEMVFGMTTADDAEQLFYTWYADADDVAAVDGAVLEKEGSGWVLKLPFGYLEAGEYPIFVKATDEEGKKSDFRAILRLSPWEEVETPIEIEPEIPVDPEIPQEIDPGVYPELDHVELSPEKDRLLIIGTRGDYLYRPDEDTEFSEDESAEAKGYYTLYVLNVAEEVIAIYEEETEGALANIPIEGLESGVYTVVLSAYGFDDNLRAIRSIAFTYKAPEKQETEVEEIIPGNATEDDPFGNLHIGFTDIVTTFPFGQESMSRYYNSNHLEKGDFGYGWTMGLLGLRLEESTYLNEGYSLKNAGSKFSTTYYIEETKSHDIVVRYGDGSYDRFEVSLSPKTQAIRPIEHVNVGFECVTSDGVELAIDGDNGAQYIEGMLLWDDESNDNNINYVLTTRDGTKLYLNAQDGLKRIVDTNGNVTTVDKNGYHSENGQGIDWNKDSEDRITKAWDHLGHSMTYTYDSNGNLIRTEDTAGNTVSYSYNSKHYLTSIVGPDGKEVARNNYDDNGRLVSVTDADGNTTNYSYEDDGRTEAITDANGNITVYTYDDHGNVLTETDPYGYTARNTYDDKNNLLTQTDKRGNTNTYTYDEKGNVTSITAADGTTSTSSVDQSTNTGTVTINGVVLATAKTDSNGNVTQVIDALGHVTDYSYTSDGKISSISDEIGVCNTFTYNAEGQVISVASGDGTKVEFLYDSYGNVTTMRIVGTDGTVHTAEMLYDLSGNLTGTVDEEGNTTSYVNDARGNVISSTDTMGRVTTYTYDSLSRVTAVNYPDGTKESFTYDGNGNCLTATDRLGLVRKMSYDKCNRLTKITYPDGTAESFSYDANGNVSKHTSVTGAVTTYNYNSRNFLTSVKRDDGAGISYTYDEQGRTTAYTDANGNTWKYEYDKIGNRISMTVPDGGVTKASYDARGRITDNTDAEGNKTVYTYDSMNRLTSVKDTLGNTWSYSYDFMGNLLSVTDAGNHTTSYGYDVAGRCIQVTNAAGDSRTYEYDAEGKILKSTDYDDSTTTYSYDENGYQTGIAHNGKTISVAYDAYGRLTSINNGVNTVSYTYDSCSRVESRNDGSGNTLHYGYDTYGRLNSIVAKRGESVISSTGYTYDKYDRLVKVTDTAGNATVYTYDALGLVSTMTTADGTVTEYGYDSCGRIVDQTVTTVDGTKVFDYSYTYGLCSEMQSATEVTADGKSIVTTYTYDELLRLVQEKTTDGTGTLTIGYAYDAVSNRTSMSVTSEGDISGFVSENDNLSFGTTSYAYNALNQLTSENSPAGMSTYAYDKNGNLTSILGAKAVQYSYDEYGRLKSVSVTTKGANEKESYTYDAEGNRISRTTKAGTVYYVNDACADLTQVIAETDANGTLKKEYTRGLSVISATNGAAETSYFVNDGQGNIRAIVSGGVVADTYRYDAYGNLIEKTGDSDNDLLYNGEQYSEATGLYYLRARYMDPTTGRFISMDAYSGELANPTSLHKYLYANANPVMYSDPSGYAASMAEGLTSMAITGILVGAAKGAIIGALTGYLDASLDPTKDRNACIWEALKGFLIGGIFGGLLENASLVVKGIAGITGAVLAFAGAAESHDKGYTWQSRFRFLMGVVSVVGVVKSVIGSRNPNPSGTKGVLSDNNGQRADSGKEGIRWIYSFGNKTGPRGARPIADFNVEGFEKIVGPERGPLPKGASNVFDPNTAPLNGHYHKLPFDTILPRGLGIIEDGIDVVPDSPHGPGHVTIYPTEEMTVGEFNELYKSLPWEYGGKK